MMKRLIPYFTITFIILMCIFSDKCIVSAKNAVNTCIYVLLPSLFPFFVFSKIFIMTNGGEKIGRYLKFITKPLFNMSGQCASVFVLGILCGYPVGAKSALDMYKQNAITKEEAQNLIGFCNNSGPLFLIGAVGIGMFSSKKFGIMLYLVHILSAITVGIILRGNIKSTNNKLIKTKTNIQDNIFVKSVEESVITILNVFGYVILFAVIITFIESAFFAGIFEMTTAISNISKMNLAVYQKFILSAFFASWGGLSVHMQTIGIISGSDLSMKKYIFAKFLHSIIAFIYAIIAIKLAPFYQSTFAMKLSYQNTSNILNFFAILSAAIIGIYLYKLNIIILNKK